MKPSEKAYDLIKKFEGLVLHAYPDPASGGKPYTIGYGSTRHKDGTPVKLGEVVTKEEAEELMEHEVDSMSEQIKVEISQSQFDALCVFAYNCGIDALLKSTLYKKVKANPNDPDIQKEFMRWVFASGRLMPGLFNRRKAEWELYTS